MQTFAIHSDRFNTFFVFFSQEETNVQEKHEYCLDILLMDFYMQKHTISPLQSWMWRQVSIMSSQITGNSTLLQQFIKADSKEDNTICIISLWG